MTISGLQGKELGKELKRALTSQSRRKPNLTIGGVEEEDDADHPNANTTISGTRVHQLGLLSTKILLPSI